MTSRMIFYSQSHLREKSGEISKILIGRPMKSLLSCVSAVCTHRPVLISKGIRNGESLRCHCHGAVFNIQTGDVIAAPATTPLRRYSVKVDDSTDTVLVDIDQSQGQTDEANETHDGIEHIVIIGSGAAGVSAAEELLKCNFNGKISIISSDDHEPYDRNPGSNKSIMDCMNDIPFKVKYYIIYIKLHAFPVRVLHSNLVWLVTKSIFQVVTLRMT